MSSTKPCHRFAHRVLKFLLWFCRRKRIRQEHEIEFPDVECRHLVFYHKGRVIVCIDKRLDLDWKTSDACDEKMKDSADAAFARNEVSRLEVRIGSDWPRGLIIRAKRMLGEGLARVYDGRDGEVKKAFEDAEGFIKGKSIEVSRCWIVETAFLWCGLVQSCGLALVVHKGFFAVFLGQTLHTLLLGGCMGAVGSLLALLIRLGTVQIGSDAGLALHRIEAGAKILAGFICGFLMSMLIKAGLLFGSFAASPHSVIILLAMAMVAGMTSRWVPSLLARVTNEVESDGTGGKETK